MNVTPNSNRLHITLYGRRNSGKSSLLNALTGQEAAVVSPVAGTTTDPVGRAMEIMGLGPCLLTDTPGFDDEGQLGGLRTRETRNTCTYCSVGCGLLMYSLGDGAKNAKASIFHIEGDPDHPVNRGALCPKGAGLVDFIHSESRLKFPEYRAPGSDKWQQISWEEAFDRIAKLMKEDRDANYIAQNAEGVTVNRWLSTGMLCASASSNETGYLTQKFSRALGMLAVDNQARV